MDVKHRAPVLHANRVSSFGQAGGGWCCDLGIPRRAHVSWVTVTKKSGKLPQFFQAERGPFLPIEFEAAVASGWQRGPNRQLTHAETPGIEEEDWRNGRNLAPLKRERRRDARAKPGGYTDRTISQRPIEERSMHRRIGAVGGLQG